MDRIIAFDPGKITGVVSYTKQRSYLYTCHAFTKEEVYEFLADTIRHPGHDPKAFVVERYIHFPVQAANSGFQEIDATHIIGAIELTAHFLGIEVYKQTSSDAKTLITNEILRKHGLYDFPHFKANAKHVRDACRHLILHQLKQTNKENK